MLEMELIHKIRDALDHNLTNNRVITKLLGDCGSRGRTKVTINEDIEVEIKGEEEDCTIPIEDLIIMQIIIKDISTMAIKGRKGGAQDRLTKDMRINLTMVIKQEPPINIL